MQDFESLFAQVEKAIDDHPKLQRIDDIASAPQFTVCRLGWSIEIVVRLRGSRKRPTKIRDSGETAEAAVEKLVGSLDIWAEVLK